MRVSYSLAISALASIIPLTSAAPHIARTSCTNSASNRSCWGDFDLTSDYYNLDNVPNTGVIRDFYFELVNTTASPDGVERMVLTVNGTVPGPTIIANWGDTVRVHLTNGLANNGTGLHFHGIRQYETPQMDGVPSISQCALAPGDEYVYTWRATQYGSSWYHSHFSLQAWNGVFGGIIINGPATANYDEDLGNLFLNDWTHETIDEMYSKAETSGPPTLDNGLINGTNVYGDVGSRFETTFESGKSYLLRLVNGAIDTHFKFSIDSHTLTVIATDFVPIVPYTTDVLSIGIGQRYDVIVSANETVDNYWMRAIPQTSCSDNDEVNNIRGIVRYNSTSTDNPTTSAYSYEDSCDDEDVSNLVPYLSMTVDNYTVENDEAITVGTKNSVFKWYMAATTFLVDWADPTLLNIYDNGTDATFTTNEHVIQVDDADEWVYIVIETSQSIPHPIHLHGHDFYIVAQGSGSYVDGTTAVNLDNPPRRDTAMLPSSGYLVIAFLTDNPGAWLVHCHIAWHASEGFALQVVERISEIPALIDGSVMNSTCSNWDTYVAADDIEQDDSGI